MHGELELLAGGHLDGVRQHAERERVEQRMAHADAVFARLDAVEPEDTLRVRDRLACGSEHDDRGADERAATQAVVHYADHRREPRFGRGRLRVRGVWRRSQSGGQHQRGARDRLPPAAAHGYSSDRTEPPSTRIAWPVMNAAREEARNAMTAETSSGVPSRCEGVSAR